MKRFKKIMALVIAMAMVVAMALPAMAATIKVDDTSTTHQYKVYQIFKGTLTEEQNPTTGAVTKTLADIVYGSNYAGKGGDGVTAATEAKALAEASGTDPARAFATALTDGEASNGEISGSPVATLSSANGFKAENLADGYYLIIDDTAKEIDEGDSFSRYIVQVIGDVEIAPKKSTVEEHKNIKSDTHTPSGVTTDKSADDLSIGETVTFTIDATVPLNATDYDKYFFVINDTLSEGLTLDTTSFSVYTKSGSTTTTLEEATNYTLFVTDPEGATTTHTAPDSGKTFQIALKNAASYAGQTIYVEYTATLNENAEIGEIPNTNKTTVTYSNNPENKYDGEDKDNDGKPDNMDKDIYGESPEQETKTFTSSIQLKKVDENGAALQGAEFEITGDSVKTVVITTDVFTEDANGTYYKLKDGTYTTVEPAEEDTYVSKGTGKADGGYVKVTDNETGGVTYEVATYDQLNDTTTEIFVKVTATADQYDSTETKYKKETKAETVETTTQVTAKAFVDANGIVKFDGLGAGTYKIKETTVPAGYNKIDDITVTIAFDKDDADKDTTNNDTADEDALVWKATSTYVATEGNAEGNIIEIDSDNDSKVDTFQIQIENKKGTVLPSTGGIGTTIFYVVGAILVIGAGVVMITRRRMDA